MEGYSKESHFYYTTWKPTMKKNQLYCTTLLELAVQQKKIDKFIFLQFFLFYPWNSTLCATLYVLYHETPWM